MNASLPASEILLLLANMCRPGLTQTEGLAMARKMEEIATNVRRLERSLDEIVIDAAEQDALEARRIALVRRSRLEWLATHGWSEAQLGRRP